MKKASTKKRSPKAAKKSAPKKATRAKPPKVSTEWGVRNNKKALLVTVANVTDAARYFGIDRHTFRDWLDKGCPQQPGGEIILNDARDWAAKHIYGPRYKESQNNDVHAHLRIRRMEQEVRREELQWAKEIEAVLPTHFVDEMLEIVALKYQHAGDLLLKHHGDQAQKIVLDTNQAIQKEIEKRFADAK